MVRRHLLPRGLTDRRVLAAMASVPREHFVPPELMDRSYADLPLPIPRRQTISQPYIVALMTFEAGLGRNSRVLEVGTGTGYHTAVLAKIAFHVWSVERLEDLSNSAERRLKELGVDNVTLIVGDGALGHPGAAPYDAIVVTAASPAAPQPLLAQLAGYGRLVIPVGDRIEQMLRIYQNTTHEIRQWTAGPCRFVPLVSPVAFDAEV